MPFTAASVYGMLASRGRSVTLRRLGNSPPDDVSVLAMIADYEDEEGAVGVTQFRRKVTISNKEIADAGWPGPPRPGDQVISDGRTMTVRAVLPVVILGATIMHRLETLGR